jgi:hypothetical protein
MRWLTAICRSSNSAGPHLLTLASRDRERAPAAAKPARGLSRVPIGLFDRRWRLASRPLLMCLLRGNRFTIRRCRGAAWRTRDC